MLGFATSYTRELMWILASYAVRPGLQGAGIGAQLLAAALHQVNVAVELVVTAPEQLGELPPVPAEPYDDSAGATTTTIESKTNFFAAVPLGDISVIATGNGVANRLVSDLGDDSLSFYYIDRELLVTQRPDSPVQPLNSCTI